MATRLYKPTTPARRGMTSRDTSELSGQAPTKSLLARQARSSGRNTGGRITVRHRGGGAKRHYRLVDFKGTQGNYRVESIEYDPNRSAHIALIRDKANRAYYVLAPAKIKVGSQIEVGEETEIKPGNRLKLAHMPVGSFIFNVELVAGRGGQLVRSAGASAQLVAREGDWAQVKLPSGEVRLIHASCYATLGSVGNEQHGNIKWGSAGRKRRMGRRPSVRGKAMNPADHPMGGGEGLSKPGRLPRTPWGKLAIGKKTRRRKLTDKYVVRSRKVSRRG